MCAQIDARSTQGALIVSANETSPVDAPAATTPATSPPGLLRGYGQPGLFGLRLFAVLLTAISQPLLSAPFSWWPMHWFAWLPFLWAISQQEGRGRMWLAFIGGTASNYMIFYWIVNMIPTFAKLPMPIAIAINLALCMWLSVIWVLLAWLIPILRREFPQLWVLAAPALFAALEFCVPQLFPYMQGVSHYQVTPIFMVVSLFGVYAMTFLIFWCNCLLFHVWQSRGKLALPRVHYVAFGVVIVAALVYGFTRQALYERAAKRARSLTVGLIQANYRPDVPRHNAFQNYVDLSKEAVKKGAQWVIWSEGEFKPPLNTRGAQRLLRVAAKRVQRPILTGGWSYRYIKKQRIDTNSAWHVQPSGTFGKRHDKVILLPFGEFMPFEKELHFIYKHIKWRPRYKPGKHMVVNKLDGVSYGFLICYEAILPMLVRQSIRRGAGLLVNITYDAWFGRTTAPYQHLMLAAIRSAEYGVPLARLATTGVSTTVDALGRMAPLSKLFKRQVIVQEVQLVTMPTLYTRIGDVFAATCVVFVIYLLLLAWVRRRLVLPALSDAPQT